MPWIPAAAAHAIERTRIAIVFSPELSPKIIEAAGRAADPGLDSLGFPARSPLNSQNFSVQFGPDGPKLTGQKGLGWQSLKSTEPGSIVEVLQLDKTTIQYESAIYVRWALFVDHFRQLAGKAIDSLDAVSDAQMVSLEYFDRFNFDGPKEKALPAELVDARFVNVLAEPAKMGEELWHLHRGWFSTTEGERFLVNQNVDVLDGQTAEGEVLRTAQIMTKIERRAAEGPITISDLAALLEKMHTISKATLVGVLSGDAQAKIGL